MGKRYTTKSIFLLVDGSNTVDTYSVKCGKKEEEKTREVMRLDNGIRRIFKVKVSDRNLNVERERESYFSSYF